MPYKDPKSKRAIESNRRKVKRYQSTPHGKLKSQDRRYRKTYNISLEVYQALLESQNGLCAICEKSESILINSKARNLAVDHDHKTGKIRGLLCIGCNQALALAKEDINTLGKMIAYIKKHN